MKLLICFALLFATLTTCAQKEINLEDVKSRVGDSVKIDAVIYGGKYLETAKGKPTFLNVGEKYPNQTLTLVIWDKVRSKFEHQPIEKFYYNKKVIITGVIKEYKGKLEIEIHKPEQIQETIKVDVKQ